MNLSLGWEIFLVCFSQYSWAAEALHCLLHMALGYMNKSYKNNQIFLRKNRFVTSRYVAFFWSDCP